jgi:hypothetical protein
MIERIWMEVLTVSFSYCPASCLEGLRKVMKNFSLEDWCPGPDSNRAFGGFTASPSPLSMVLCVMYTYT